MSKEKALNNGNCPTRRKQNCLLIKISYTSSIDHDEAGRNGLWGCWDMEKTITKDVVYARIRVAGLKRAIDDEPSADVKAAMLTYLRREEDHLSDYAVTGIYEEE